MWISATSCATPVRRTSSGSPAQDVDDPGEQPALPGCVDERPDDRDDLRERRPLGGLARGGDRGHRVRVHERVRAVERRRRRRPAARRPRPPRSPGRPRTPAPSGGRAGGSGRRRRRSRSSPSSATVASSACVEVGEVVDDVALAEEQVRHRAAAVEDLVGQLAAQHQVVGDALARHLLGQRVERLDAGGGEGEQVAVATAVDDEGVAVRSPGPGAISATASSTGTSQGRPTPSASGGGGVIRERGTAASCHRRQVRSPLLEPLQAITAHWCCGIRRDAPRGHDQPTRQRVARSILVNGPSTAAALAERLDLTPAAVRRHLDQLLEEGLVEAREPRNQATRGRGRPAKVVRADRVGARRLRPAVRRPRRPGAPVPGRDRGR